MSLVLSVIIPIFLSLIHLNLNRFYCRVKKPFNLFVYMENKSIKECLILYHKSTKLFLIICSLCLFFSSDLAKMRAESLEINYSYRVINSYPHDPQAFTQGLVYHQGNFYEGTGLYGQSSLRQIAPNGEFLRQIQLPTKYFGEGITILGDKIYQLTWRENVGFVYDLASFELIETFDYPTEGWGLTTDGTWLIMSDGSSKIFYLDPANYTVVKEIQVNSSQGPVELLNELEYIQGLIFANIWLTDQIVMINPDHGQVIGWIDLTGLLEPELREKYTVDVLNGIAYDQDNDRIFVTGKLWPRIYEIEVF